MNIICCTLFASLLSCCLQWYFTICLSRTRWKRKDWLTDRLKEGGGQYRVWMKNIRAGTHHLWNLLKKKKKIHTNQRSIQEEGYQQWLDEMKDSSLHGIQKLSPGTHCSQSVQPSTKYWNQGMDLIFVHLNTCKISDHMLSAVFLVQWRYGIKSVSSSSPSASSCVLQ